MDHLAPMATTSATSRGANVEDTSSLLSTHPSEHGCDCCSWPAYVCQLMVADEMNKNGTVSLLEVTMVRYDRIEKHA